MKRFLSLLIAFIMVMSTGTMAFAGTTDYENSWAKKEIDYMKEKGILQGDQNGNFKPNNQIRKSEFYRVINGLIGYQGKADNVFSDVNSSDWFFEEVEKGLAAKYLSGGQVLNARDNITREEVARIIGFVFDVEEDKKAAEFFEDSDLIKDELKGIIGGLRANGFINGFPDKTFRPTIEIKRSDVVKMLYDISGQIINKAGTHSMDANNNVVVNTEDVVLEDMTIEGNLYLTEGIGEGDVTLDNVTVKGEVIVKGGGANSVIIKNSIINKISVDKQQGLVRVVFENTRVEQVTTAREVKVELTKGSKIEEVKLDGKIELVAEEGTSIESIDATSKEVTITSKGNIGAIKTTHEIKVNDKKVEANTEVKVEGGKAPEVKKETPAAKPADTSSGTAGGGGGGVDYRDPIVDESTTTPRPPTPTPGPTAAETEKEMNRVIDLLEDGMLDDVIYPGDKKDGDKTLYSLASLVSEEVRKNLNLKNIGISVGNFNGEYDENDKPVWGTNDIKYGYYEIRLYGAGKTVSKQIRIDTISVDTEKGFRDAWRYDINKINLKKDINVSGELLISKLISIDFGEYELNINGKLIEQEYIDVIFSLGRMIEDANYLVNNSEEGSDIGQYKVGSIKILKAAIEKAKLEQSINVDSTTEMIIKANKELNQAIRTFGAGQVKPVLSVAAVNKTVTVGDTDYKLPETVQVKVEGKEELVTMNVKWDKELVTTNAGTFKFVGTLELPEGYVNTNNVTAKLTIVVEDKDIEEIIIQSVATVEDITVEEGTEVVNLNLPKELEVTLSNDTTTKAAIEWEVNNLDLSTTSAGITIYGVIKVPTNVEWTNKDDIKAKVKIIIIEKNTSPEIPTTTPSAIELTTTGGAITLTTSSSAIILTTTPSAIALTTTGGAITITTTSNSAITLVLDDGSLGATDNFVYELNETKVVLNGPTTKSGLSKVSEGITLINDQYLTIYELDSDNKVISYISIKIKLITIE